jgi:membrane-associated phospholipid phosphatase
MNVSPYFRNSRWYFWALILLFLTGFLLLAIDGKGGSFILLNSYHSNWLTTFFIIYTNVGDGIFALCIVALLFFYKRKPEALALLLSFLISGLLAQIIKNLVTSPRPRLFFTNGEYAKFIDGVTLSNNSSFPSGHTASAFAVATVLTLTMQNKNWKLPILFAAALVGYSRMYLAQHFLTDVMMGAFLGVISGMYAVYLVYHTNITKRSKRKKDGAGSDTTFPSTSEIKPA